MKKETEEKIIQEISQNINEKYEGEDGEDELIEQELEERRIPIKMQSWKESKQMLMIIIPILSITYIAIKIFGGKTPRRKSSRILRIEQELKKN